MNLYFRLIALIFRSFLMAKATEVKRWERNFRVMPWDCDINLHMTNSRYIALQDLARTYAIAELGILGKMVKEKCLPILGAQEITYIKALMPFQKFTLSTQLLYWDEKYYYMAHRFESKGKLYATSMIRGVFVQNGKVVPTEKVLEMANMQVESPIISPEIEAWKNLLEEKKQGNLA